MAKKVKWLFGAGLIAGVFFVGCGGDGSSLGPDGTPEENGNGDNGNGNGAEKVTLAELSTEIFTPKCAFAGCHGGANPAGGMSLAADVIAADIVDVAATANAAFKRIDPGNPDDSYIVMKIEGRGITGRQMPPNATPLSAEEIEKIRSWIADGAPTE
jgi:hypothetical protein